MRYRNHYLTVCRMSSSYEQYITVLQSCFDNRFKKPNKGIVRASVKYTGGSHRTGHLVFYSCFCRAYIQHETSTWCLCILATAQIRAQKPHRCGRHQGRVRKNQTCCSTTCRFMTIGVRLSHSPFPISTQGVLNTSYWGETGERGFSQLLCIGTETRVAFHGAWRRGVGG